MEGVNIHGVDQEFFKGRRSREPGG